MISYLIQLPPGTVLPSLNDRPTWKDREDYHRHIIIIRETTCRIALEMRIPKMDRVHVRGILYYPDNRRRDPGNYTAATKPMIDGIVKAGVIPDDSDAYLTDHGVKRARPNIPGGLLALQILQAEGVSTEFRIDTRRLFLRGRL